MYVLEVTGGRETDRSGKPRDEEIRIYRMCVRLCERVRERKRERKKERERERERDTQ